MVYCHTSTCPRRDHLPINVALLILSSFYPRIFKSLKSSAIMSLHITAGPLPDLTTHKVLKPNTPQKVETPLCTTEVTLFLPPSQFLSTHRPNNPFSLVIRTTFHRSIASEKLFFFDRVPYKNCTSRPSRVLAC